VAAVVTGAGESAQPFGSFAEESARLLAVLQEWAAKGRAAAHDLAGEVSSGVDGAGHSPECTVCPVCQAIRLARGVRPEVIEHLSEAATSFLAALSALVATEPDGAATARPQRDRVQHIDVTGADDGESAPPGSGAAG
jgi:hypothetical protein